MNEKKRGNSLSLKLNWERSRLVNTLLGLAWISMRKNEASKSWCSEAFSKVIPSWTWKKFISGCVILFPIAITLYITWWFIHFVDDFFSPIYNHLGINVFGSYEAQSLCSEGIEIVISGGMAVPKLLNIQDVQSILSPRVGKFAVPQV
ncbi:hypothetical protein K7X08_019722 [Anisodus acutangulus]|uniref:Uncharacterized protein n=1 Tax=Anisodus acutangulus TaxID=402998 RepID=A0A9Q1MT29_9SOLA|nr:hypothetical protein K7X08_019722 [Anisodus acutangulus]